MTGMRRITVRLPEPLFEEVEERVDSGDYPNRAELLRAGLRKQLARDRQLADETTRDTEVDRMRCPHCGSRAITFVEQLDEDWMWCKECQEIVDTLPATRRAGSRGQQVPARGRDM